jgi:hypothetical protein
MTTLVTFLTILTGQALINHFGINLTAKLTDFSGYTDLRDLDRPDRGLPGRSEATTSRGSSRSQTTQAKQVATSGRRCRAPGFSG